MDLATSLALHASGVEAWNGWASSCMERRRKLVSTGMWCWERDSRTDTVPLNAETRSWMQDAAAQFSYHEFAETADFSSFVFPGAALFVATKLPQGARFRGARFRDGACFNFAHFGATAVFDAAVFCSIAEFRNTHFLGEAHFRDCHFKEAGFEPTSDGRIDCSDACSAMPASFARIHCQGCAACRHEDSSRRSASKARPLPSCSSSTTRAFVGRCRCKTRGFPTTSTGPVQN